MTIMRIAIVISCALVFAGCSHVSDSSPLPAAGNSAARVLAAATYKSLYSFKGGADGSSPSGGVTAVKDAFYGTTAFGGANGDGTVFDVSSSGVEHVLHSFEGSDGRNPESPLLLVKSTLYGTTPVGGQGGPEGYGTVFKIATSGTERVLYTFKGNTDGAAPDAGVIAFGSMLYGTTNAGGGSGCSPSGGCGTAFKITTAGSESTLYAFKGDPDGDSPEASLLDVSGTFYGTTLAGGANGDGTVFTLTPSGQEAVIHSFGIGTDGIWPLTGLTLLGGALYGTTELGGTDGCGTVFKITTAGSERVLHSFKCYPDGRSPEGRLVVLSGALYGTTNGGGVNDLGTVFKVTASGSEGAIYSFKGEPDGESPKGNLIVANGVLYGTTVAGGTNGNGTVFSITP